MSRPHADYRTRHLSPPVASRYDALFGPGTYEDWVWEFERHDLETLVDQYVFSHKLSVRFLDVACGAGRVLSLLESKMLTATGVDVSEAMLALARKRVSRATLLATDITKPDGLPAGGFDLITAFRFFLNAGPNLRADALRAIRWLLADDGVFILNIHGNLWSLHFIPYMVRGVIMRRDLTALSLHSMSRLLAQHGFQVEAVAGQAWCTRRVYAFIGRRVCDWIERRIRQTLLSRLFSVNLMIVCRKR